MFVTKMTKLSMPLIKVIRQLVWNALIRNEQIIHLESFVDEAFVIELLKHPPDAFHKRWIHCLIVVLEVNPPTQSRHNTLETETDIPWESQQIIINIRDVNADFFGKPDFGCWKLVSNRLSVSLAFIGIWISSPVKSCNFYFFGSHIWLFNVECLQNFSSNKCEN